jgi:hypothetical protein
MEGDIRMKVKDLIEILQEQSPDTLIVMSKDAEGNGFSPLYTVSPDAYYVPETTWMGDAYTEEDMKECYDDEGEDRPEAGSAIIMWPVN